MGRHSTFALYENELVWYDRSKAKEAKKLA